MRINVLWVVLGLCTALAGCGGDTAEIESQTVRGKRGCHRLAGTLYGAFIMYSTGIRVTLFGGPLVMLKGIRR